MGEQVDVELVAGMRLLVHMLLDEFPADVTLEDMIGRWGAPTDEQVRGVRRIAALLELPEPFPFRT